MGDLNTPPVAGFNDNDIVDEGAGAMGMGQEVGVNNTNGCYDMQYDDDINEVEEEDDLQITQISMAAPRSVASKNSLAHNNNNNNQQHHQQNHQNSMDDQILGNICLSSAPPSTSTPNGGSQSRFYSSLPRPSNSSSSVPGANTSRKPSTHYSQHSDHSNISYNNHSSNMTNTRQTTSRSNVNGQHSRLTSNNNGLIWS